MTVRVDAIWRPRVFALAAGPGGMRSRRIWQQLRENFGLECPSERWVENRLKEWDRLPLELKQNFYSLRWPDSMLSGALPLEAAPAALELLRLLSGFGRPPIGLARWFWRVSASVPGAPPQIRLSIAQDLASQEAVHGPDFLSNDSCEMFLVHRPWESGEANERWLAACESAGVRPFSGPETELPPDADLETVVEAVAIQMGHYRKGFKGVLKQLQKGKVFKSVQQSYFRPAQYVPEKRKEDDSEERE